MVDDKIICMHGGLSPEMESLDQIKAIERPLDVPDQGLLCDILWSDPDSEIKGWGVSYTFGPDKVAEFLKKHDLDLNYMSGSSGWSFSKTKKTHCMFE